MVRGATIWPGEKSLRYAVTELTLKRLVELQELADKNASKTSDGARINRIPLARNATRGLAVLRLAQESMVMAAKKAPNPIDKHVGSRVRMRRMMLAMS